MLSSGRNSAASYSTTQLISSSRPRAAGKKTTPKRSDDEEMRNAKSNSSDQRQQRGTGARVASGGNEGGRGGEGNGGGFQSNKMRRASNARGKHNRTAPLALEPLKEGHRIDPQERVFLEAAERGDKPTVMRCLQGPNRVNVNCTNILGRSAIQIAVDNENVEIVELLLKQDGVKIGDALLYAVREGVYRIVEMLIDHPSISREMLGCEWSTHKRAETEESSDYSPDVSPIILAAHCNQFEILQLLLSRGARIVKPHPLTCSCQRCKKETSEDSLRHSLLRIHTFRALSSPAWISLTSPDPVLTAFKLSWELDHLAMRENEFKDLYAELSEQCKKYSCNLLDQCRSSEEVIAVLNQSCNSTDDLIDMDDDNTPDGDEYDDDGEEEDPGPEHVKLTLNRFKMALKYEQKQFVAHPHCQQLLASIWYEGIPGWRRHGFLTKVIVIITLICLLPLMAVVYLVFPRSKLGLLVRTPFMKFMYHSASFGVFLFLLIMASTNVSAVDGDQKARQQQRGPPPSLLEWLIVAYVMGFVWAECKQLWEEGLKAYIRQWWNWLDFIMLSLYLCTISLRLVAFFHSFRPETYGPSVQARTKWPDADPTLISEGVFAIANVFSFARIIFLFQANPQLGPLQISLGCMLIDIGKFFFIFFLVITSFACGLNQLYYFYSASGTPPSQLVTTTVFKTIAGEGNVTTSGHVTEVGDGSATTSSMKQVSKSIDGMDGDYENAFDPIFKCYVTLFWSLFGLTQLSTVREGYTQPFTKSVGEYMLMVYHTMAVIVLINMLIAMMSNSFQEIEDHADREWKFARSKLWMGYFDDGSTLPPPFNLIISPKAVYYFLRRIKCIILGCLCIEVSPHRRPRKIAAKRTSPNGDVNGYPANNERRKYKDVMRRLVSRFIHQWKKQLRQDGVSEDDLLEIKQDISSLRYELREDRKREELQTALNNENLKRDLMRHISTSSGAGVTSGGGLGTWVGSGGGSGRNLAYQPGVAGASSRQSSLDKQESFASMRNSYFSGGGGGGGGGVGAGGGGTGHGGRMSPDELNLFKREIVSCLRLELQDISREMCTAAAGGQSGATGSGAGRHVTRLGGSPAIDRSSASSTLHLPHTATSTSGFDSDLYQTHFYTEL